MKYSVNYKSAHKQEADEIRCPYNQLGMLWEFIKENKDKRYIVSIDNSVDYDKLYQQLDIIKSTGCDYGIAAGRLEALKTVLEGAPAYWTAPVTDWETFSNLVELGVSDIYIDGPLCFQMDKLIARKGDVKLRVAPQHSPNSVILGAAANSFYIRPEDLSFYSAIDVIDFNTYSTELEDELFKIYKRGHYDGYIDTIIPGLAYHVPNAIVSNELAQKRSTCGQVCKSTSVCHYCDNYFRLIKNTTDYFQEADAT